MAKIDVCLETVFTSLPVEERLKRIAQAGYAAVEFWHKECTWNGKDLTGPAKDTKRLKAALDRYKLTMTDMVLNAWDASLGGSLVNPEDQKIYLENLNETIKFAKDIACSKLITCTGKKIAERPPKEQRDSILATLSKAAKIVEGEGITLLLEPLNTYVDHPRYFLASAEEGAEIVRGINHPNVRLLYDIYHMQIMEGNIISTIEKNIDVFLLLLNNIDLSKNSLLQRETATTSTNPLQISNGFSIRLFIAYLKETRNSSWTKSFSLPLHVSSASFLGRFQRRKSSVTRFQDWRTKQQKEGNFCGEGPNKPQQTKVKRRIEESTQKEELGPSPKSQAYDCTSHTKTYN